MKKTVLALLCITGFMRHVTSAIVMQDTAYPSVFYNAARFPTGLRSKESKVLIAKNPWVMGFDLNDVVFLPNYSQIWEQTKERALHKGIFSTFKTLAKIPTVLVHKVYRDYYQQDLEARALDGYLQSLFSNARSQEEKEFVEFFRTFIQKINILNFPVIKLAQELQQEGHHTIALTNMGIHFIATQKELLEAKLVTPHISSEEQSAIGTLITLLSDPRSTMPCPETKWRTKPHPEIYQFFLDRNKVHTGYFGFIDDKEKNVRVAIENGIDVAFVFTTSHELERSLRSIGLLPSK